MGQCSAVQRTQQSIVGSSPGGVVATSSASGGGPRALGPRVELISGEPVDVGLRGVWTAGEARARIAKSLGIAKDEVKLVNAAAPGNACLENHARLPALKSLHLQVVVSAQSARLVVAAPPSREHFWDMFFISDYREPKGEGFFGIVLRCQKLTTRQRFSVKMIDRVETPPADLKREVDVVQKLEGHPNVAKMHAVFYEKFFVCVVMDEYRIDLARAFIWHARSFGIRSCHGVRTLGDSAVKQMCTAILYVHGNHVVHRDVKADNFLIDRVELADPACKVVLSDFGAACECRPGERLRDWCGTRIFWAPEVFDQSYSFKVDVWALGVTLYWLTSGKLPFRQASEIKVKIPTLQDAIITDTFADFVTRMLEKRETIRPNAADVMKHAWIRKIRVRVPPTPCECSANMVVTDVVGDSAPEFVTERRLELVHRMIPEQPCRCHRCACLCAKTGVWPRVSRGTQWWREAEAKAGGLLAIEAKAAGLENEVKSTPHEVRLFEHLLNSYGVDVGRYGSGAARTLEDFVSQVRDGRSRLMLDATAYKKLVRVVDVVVLRIRAAGPAPGAPYRVLVESKQCDPDRYNRDLLQLPGAVKQPHENTSQTVERILQDMMHMEANLVEFDRAHDTYQEEATESPHFPGLPTVYRTEVIVGTCVNPYAGAFQVVDLAQAALTRSFEWLTVEETRRRNVDLKLEGASSSALARAPVGLEEGTLMSYLRRSIENGGTLGTCTLGEGLEATSRTSAESEPIGASDASRYLDKVALLIRRATSGDVLVQVGEHPSEPHTAALRLEDEVARDAREEAGRPPAAGHTASLPEIFKGWDEGPFVAAERLLKSLGLLGLTSESPFTFVAGVGLIQEELPQDEEEHVKVPSSSRHSRTIRRTWLVRGEMAS